MYFMDKINNFLDNYIYRLIRNNDSLFISLLQLIFHKAPFLIVYSHKNTIIPYHLLISSINLEFIAQLLPFGNYQIYDFKNNNKKDVPEGYAFFIMGR
jgi:hypothetical protein